MPRIRTIKPEFWDSEKLAQLPYGARLLFIGLWNFADDSGRLRGAIPYISGRVFPYDEKADVEKWLGMLSKIGAIRQYSVNGESFIDIPKFNIHQYIEKKKPSTLPPFTYQSPTNPLPVGEEDASGMEGNGREGKGMDPLPPSAGAEGFDILWKAYPKKKAKAEAFKAWKFIRPDQNLLAKMLVAIEAQKQTPEWLKENGQFIPYPATWLRAKRWEDELKVQTVYEERPWETYHITEEEWNRQKAESKAREKAKEVKS